MSQSQTQAIAEFPDKLKCLFKPARYKILYGGRGGAKSWGVARALILLAARDKLRILCARELQNSIAQSVHKLLSDQITALGLGPHYDIQQASIKCVTTGSEFSFAGLRSNVDQIKSFEGVDIVWVEEAQRVSRTSWNVLIPTIRKDRSEIWITFNPELAEDETYQRFIVNPPANAIVVKINWRDNPWFPQVLKEELEALKTRDHAAYMNVWEGACKAIVDGAVFGKQMMEAEAEGRITRAPYDPSKPVHTVWDLGWSDNVAIWCVQMIGMEIRCINYLQDSQQTITHYLTELQKLGYLYDTDWMPHDAQNKTLAAAGRSIEQIMVAAGRKVRIVPRTPVADSINAARTMFPTVWFDRDKCSDGLQCLRHYQYTVDPDTRLFSKEPLHNWASHGADAFRMLGLMVREPKKPKKLMDDENSGGWMG